MALDGMGLFFLEAATGTALLLLFFPPRTLGKGFFSLHGAAAFLFVLLPALTRPAGLPPRSAWGAAALLLLYTAASQAGRARAARPVLAAGGLLAAWSLVQVALHAPVQPLALALASGATYVARGFSGEPKQLTRLIAGAIAHKGFSLIDVFSPCVTFNKVNTYAFFKERVYRLEDEGTYHPSDLMAAMEKALEFGPRLPLGLLYETERPTYEDSEPVLRKGPLVDQPLGMDRATFYAILAETT